MLQEILKEYFEQVDTGFVHIGADPKLVDSWAEIRYTPISDPELIIPSKGIGRCLLRNGVFVFHFGDYDYSKFTTICKDGDKFNTCLANIQLIPRSKAIPEKSNEFNVYSTLFMLAGNKLVWANGRIAGSNLTKDPRHPERFPFVTLRGKRIPINRVIYILWHGNIPSNARVVNIDGDRYNNSIENLRVA
jgi:hypothetical protein